MKNVLTVVAAGDQMIKTTFNLDPKFPCHIAENDSRNIAESQT